MLRRTLLAAAAVGAVISGLPRAAEAVVTYALVDQVYGFLPSGPPPSFINSQRTSFAFTISDAAVARGSFNLTFAGVGTSLSDNFLGGDVADFVSITAPERITAAQAFRASTSSLTVTFAPDQSVSSLALTFRGDTESLFLASAGAALVTGTYISDFNNCDGRCTVSGRIALVGSGTQPGTGTPVPEPMSLALLGVGLLGMTAFSRRQG